MYRIAVFSLLLFLVACEPTQRFTTFTDEELVDILFDVSLANSIAENAAVDKRDSLLDTFIDQIATIHKQDRVMVDSIIDYVHLDNQRFISISDSLDRKLKRILEDNK